MKYLFFIFGLILLAQPVTAQTYPKDSIWNAKESGLWYEYKQTMYTADNYDLSKRLIGTDSVLVQKNTDAARLKLLVR